jgi:hypothetical protein
MMAATMMMMFMMMMMISYQTNHLIDELMHITCPRSGGKECTASPSRMAALVNSVLSLL